MPENSYKPEGLLIATAENREYTSSLAGLERAMAQGKILEGMAVMCDNDRNLRVDLGKIRGFMAKEETAVCPEGEEIKDIAVITRVGKAVCFKVIGIEERDGVTVAVLSRRAAQWECINNYLMKLVPGDIVRAKVTHLDAFGAFTDIGCGVISLMSIDCISVSRISHPKDRFSVGMYIKTVIKSIDYELCRFYVSYKELLGTWEENAGRFCVGQTVSGIVRSIESYGIFVELAPNLAGLAESRDDITVGQTAAVYIKNIIPEKMKIKLVLIDSYKGELAPCKSEYFIDDDVTHIDYWQYSPPGSRKQIETVFLPELTQNEI